ncbi:MAG: hypothetical protein CFE44_10040 [Burkholderiales bacterium PBB4]|nr:MAG: hypothetical protein CFE44_10040 [Burkholderiales bacterium PBB4]
MAVNNQERLVIQALGIALFDCALGATFLADLSVAYEANGRNFAQLARTLSDTVVFKGRFPVTQTASEFANTLLSTYQLQNNTIAIDFVTAKFNAGVNKGQIAYDVAVAIASTTDALFAKAQAILTNKTTVADYFSVIKGVAATDLATLQQVVANITETTASVDAAKTAIDGPSAITVDASANLVTPSFTFTGGSGNDTLILSAGSLGALASGGQLRAGEGTLDKLTTADTTANFTNDFFAKLNATTGFEILGLAGKGPVTLDASKLTSLKHFSIESDQIYFIEGMPVGGKVTLSGSVANYTNDITVYCQFGVDDLGLTLGDAKSNGITVGGSLTIGQRFVDLSSNGTGASANVISKLQNSDDSIYTIRGSNDLTIAATQARVVGSKFDGSAATGRLNITSNTAAFSSGSALGDTIIGGSASDTLKAGLNSTVLTGKGGNDKFDVSIALAGAKAAADPNITSVTDFTKGDIMSFAAKGAETFTRSKVDVTNATSLAAALDLAAAGDGSTNGILQWFQFSGNTYVVEDMSSGKFASTDIAVKLSGLVDLSAAVYNPASHTLAILF